MGEGDAPVEPPPDAETAPLVDLAETLRGLTAKNLLESYHDAQQALDQALEPVQSRVSFAGSSGASRKTSTGRSRGESSGRRANWITIRRNWEASTRWLSDTYFCNFSLFQSMPDSWAIKHASRSSDSTGWKRSRCGRQCWATSHAIPMERWMRVSTVAMEAYAETAHLRRRELLPLERSCWGRIRRFLGDLHNLFRLIPTRCTCGWVRRARRSSIR